MLSTARNNSVGSCCVRSWWLAPKSSRSMLERPQAAPLRENLPCPPGSLPLDDGAFSAISSTRHRNVGHQQHAQYEPLCLFNAHHVASGFQPVVVFDGDGRMIAAVLRPACRRKGTQIVKRLRRLIDAIRSHWPRTAIMLRGAATARRKYCVSVALATCATSSVSLRHRRCANSPSLWRPKPQRWRDLKTAARFGGVT